MTEPQRIQLSRAAGFNLQRVSRALNGLDAVKIARPGRWGNPFAIREVATGLWNVFSERNRPMHVPTTKDAAVRVAIDCYRDHVGRNAALESAIRVLLRGKNVACFCRTDAPCHGDVILEILRRPG